MSEKFDGICRQAVEPGPERLLAGMALAAAGAGTDGRPVLHPSFLFVSLRRQLPLFSAVLQPEKGPIPATPTPTEESIKILA